jgi:hypothetical protein
MTLLVTGFSLTAMAQRDGNQNRPPKQDPPKIEPPKKDPPKQERPPDNGNRNRPQKPQEMVYISDNKIKIFLA